MNAPETIAIRDERDGDAAAISALTVEAFRAHPHSAHTEHRIIDALRADGALTLSLVAEEAGTVVGHVAFSPVVIGGTSVDWYGLGPVSVLPARQGCGIGQALVRAGLERLRALGAHGCVLVGEPAFYGRFGFARNPALSYPGVPDEYLLALAFDDTPVQGEVRYHPAFSLD